MDLKTLIEKLLTVAPPGAVVKDVLVYGKRLDRIDEDGRIVNVWYDHVTNNIIIEGDW